MSEGADWIGRRNRREDMICARQLALFRATFAGLLGPGEVPPGFHWTLCPDIAPPDALGRDGHARPGMFVPALSLARRMWAGGELAFTSPFAPDETVTRDSTVTDVTYKTGASGPLGFVTIRHVWTAAGAPRLTERQDLVYREDPKPGPSGTEPPPAPDWQGATAWRVRPDPVLLFRYSALTFNGHRIHYDHPYATGVEGYAGLVVHGPMQAIWMLNLAASVLGRLPSRFAYRGRTPLIAGTEAIIEARDGGDGPELRVRRPDGVVTMTATAS